MNQNSQPVKIGRAKRRRFPLTSNIILYSIIFDVNGDFSQKPNFGSLLRPAIFEMIVSCLISVSNKTNTNDWQIFLQTKLRDGHKGIKV